MAIGPKRIRGFKVRLQYRVGKDGKATLGLANSRTLKDAKKDLAGEKGKTPADTVRKGKRRTQGTKLRKG